MEELDWVKFFNRSKSSLDTKLTLDCLSPLPVSIWEHAHGEDMGRRQKGAQSKQKANLKCKYLSECFILESQEFSFEIRYSFAAVENLKMSLKSKNQLEST